MAKVPRMKMPTRNLSRLPTKVGGRFAEAKLCQTGCQGRVDGKGERRRGCVSQVESRKASGLEQKLIRVGNSKPATAAPCQRAEEAQSQGDGREALKDPRVARSDGGAW